MAILIPQANCADLGAELHALLDSVHPRDSATLRLLADNLEQGADNTEGEEMARFIERLRDLATGERREFLHRLLGNVRKV